MARKPKKYHYIYKTTCKVTGKFYVGMHSTDNLEDGYLGSGKILGYSRRKYGDDNHVREILEFCSSRDELKQREKEIVNEALLADPLNINLKYGGEGGGRFWNDEHRTKFRLAGTKAALESKGSKMAHSRSLKSNATRKIRFEAGLLSTESYMPFLGKMHDAETRKRISESLKKQKGRQLGCKNSQFGTCWVIKDRPIKIKKDDLQLYLDRGFVEGRKFK